MANKPSTNQDAIQGGGDNTKGAADTTAPLLSLKGLDKRFGATHALKAVDLMFEAGRNLATFGEKSAGKIDGHQTACRRLAGVGWRCLLGGAAGCARHAT